MRRVATVVSALLVLSAWSPARADDDAKAVIEKAVKAAGGLEKLSAAKVVRFKTKGNVFIMNQAFPFKGQFTVAFPDRSHEMLELDLMGQKAKFVQVLTGGKGFTIGGGMDGDLADEKLAEAKESLYAMRVQFLAPLLTDKSFELKSLGDTKVGSAAAVAVQVVSTGHNEIVLHFDKTSFLLLKMERDALNAEGNKIRSEEIYSAYKEFNGIPFATKVLVKQDGKKFLEGEADEVEFPASVDPKLFAKPEN